MNIVPYFYINSHLTLSRNYHFLQLFSPLFLSQKSRETAKNSNPHNINSLKKNLSTHGVIGLPKLFTWLTKHFSFHNCYHKKIEITLNAKSPP